MNFRAEQCAEFNNVQFEGVVYEYVLQLYFSLPSRDGKFFLSTEFPSAPVMYMHQQPRKSQ